ncbi:hypothetical protein JTB14_028253 [Gonioctena quinquepunctata]|nr:hypothetical protein JTB14_028253 [Gonioctena quinquepunctata]
MPPEENINRDRELFPLLEVRRMEWTVTKEVTMFPQEELKTATEKLKNKKALGPDEMTPESMKIAVQT